MSAFFIAQTRLKDPKKFQRYSQLASKTFAPFGGEMVARGQFSETLSSSDITSISHEAVGIVTFPSLEKLNQWYSSASYQELIPLRDEAADLTINVYQSPDG